MEIYVSIDLIQQVANIAKSYGFDIDFGEKIKGKQCLVIDAERFEPMPSAQQRWYFQKALELGYIVATLENGKEVQP